MSRNLIYVLASVVLVAVAVLYWPIVQANFVWDDWPSFHDTPWLTQGDQWKHYIFRNFNHWTYYFRPLGIAFFTLQVRAFQSTPSPMHAISLTLHLINTTLVGILSWQCAKLSSTTLNIRTWITALCMALYGLHAALIETVAWIGCQFDLITTALTLIGLIANMRIQHKAIRAGALAILFLLAACTKESAISFPLLLLIFDWLLAKKDKRSTFISTLMAVLERNWLAYAGIFISSVIYLALRHWALGAVTNGLQTGNFSPLAKLQEISFIYLCYWKVILWPIAGMSPIHPVAIEPFSYISSKSLGATTLAMGIFIFGLYTSVCRARPIGFIIVAITAALFPVLHIIPGQFELSIYHERYTTTALAVACSLLPLLYRPLPVSLKNLERSLLIATASAATLWLAASIVDVRIILPMWSNDVSLWKWALSGNPQSPQARDNLLHAYIKAKDYDAFHELGDKILDDRVPCFNCMFQIADQAMLDNDIPRAQRALDKARQSPLLIMDKPSLHRYYLDVGRLLMMENRFDDAEHIIKMSVALEPSDTRSQELLIKAQTLAKRSNPDQ